MIMTITTTQQKYTHVGLEDVRSKFDDFYAMPR